MASPAKSSEWPPKLRTVLPIFPPPEPLQQPTLPSPPRKPAFSVPYTLSTHLVPATYLRTTKPVPIPDYTFLPSATKAEKKRIVLQTTQTLFKLRGELGRQSDGHPQALWNCLNRYVRHDLKEANDRTGITLFLAHANGFPKEIWEPMLDRLLSSQAGKIIEEVWAWEAVQHGDAGLINAASASGTFDWSDNARDIVNFLSNFLPTRATNGDLPTRLTRVPEREVKERLEAGFHRRRVVFVGHSLGGTSLSFAACLYPALCTSLVLIDPIILETPTEVESGAGRKGIQMMIGGAISRRNEWPSREAVLTGFLESPFFRAWDPSVLKVYIECATYTTPSGTTKLKMPGILEAIVFADFYTAMEVFRHFHTLDKNIPLRCILPGKDEAMGIPGGSVKWVELRPTNSTNVKIPGTGHLIPHEAPRELADDLAEYLLQSFHLADSSDIVKPKL
ncbi:Alpha/Beta hydrolase protein [Crepidotus variabilis]|uniref:Alpha/Beta hydrolase protein n=1 Tax=Crepidotus variabilis TaxID=179855 RepID=A0A9P6JSB7_9AGAR|nr:Alpha/Beta hydrolase protein [Crepidotus variabilis]